MPQDERCKVCGSQSTYFGNSRILNKYNVNYFQCVTCGFVQTENPYWLTEAYSNPIAYSDVGLVNRNLIFSRIAENLIFKAFNHLNGRFLDYGGGYGLFVRFMRDLGYDFYWYDKYCQNLFAQGFESDSHFSQEYEMVTAFEVLEHLIDPLEEIRNITRFSRNLFFSTEILPSHNPCPGHWDYYAPHEGQHIAIYTIKSLSIIAQKLGLNLYSNGQSLHLLTEKSLSIASHSLFQVDSTIPKKTSLVLQDYQKILARSSVTEWEPRVAIDGVFFQMNTNGIARVWRTLLEEWVQSGVASNVVVLDRVGTAPKISGIQYRTIPAYSYDNVESDRQMLQQVCEQEGVDLFASTYYTTPISIPSVFMVHDMIPELMQQNLNNPMWFEKHRGIRNASAFVSVSANSARDLLKFFPHISPQNVIVAHNGVANHFTPATAEQIDKFKVKYKIEKPYFLLVGERFGWLGYKNAILFFQGFSQLENHQKLEILCVGGRSSLEEQLQPYVTDTRVHVHLLDDEELRIAYSGAISFICPSKYEGFGLPLLEAMACGCPVITCPNGALSEVAGDAAIYVNNDDVQGMAQALLSVQDPAIRRGLIEKGLERKQQFSWSETAAKIWDVFHQTAKQLSANNNLDEKSSSSSSHKDVGTLPQPQSKTGQIVNLATQVGDRTCSLKIFVNPQEFTQQLMMTAFSRGFVYEPDVVQALTHLLKPGDGFIDIGAHIGYFSLWAAALVGETGWVMTCEPESSNYERVLHNVQLNGFPNVRVLNVAMGDESKDTQFFVNSDNDGGHALWDVGEHPFNQKSKNHPIPRTIRMETLDQLGTCHPLNRLKLIKIDTEGAEHSILRGATTTLTNLQVPYVITEMNEFCLQKMGSGQMTLRSFMRSLGYETYLLIPNGQSPVYLPPEHVHDPGQIFNVIFSKTAIAWG